MENIKAIAVKCLLFNRMRNLPIDVFRLTGYGNKQWIIGTYIDNIDLIRQYDLEKYSKTVLAFSIQITKNEYLILFTENLSYSQRNLYIAHEIGHIVLDHTVLGFICGKSQDLSIEDRQENEANAFANYFLAPACILSAANIIASREIICATTVTDEHAQSIAGEIAKLKDYVPTSDEERLCKQYRYFIIKNKYRRNIKYSKRILAVALLIAASILITPFFTNSNKNQSASSKNPEQQHSLNEFPKQIETPVYTTSATSKGNKFHLKTCPTIKNRTNLTEWSIEDAIHAGFGECQTCTPLTR